LPHTHHKFIYPVYAGIYSKRQSRAYHEQLFNSGGIVEDSEHNGSPKIRTICIIVIINTIINRRLGLGFERGGKVGDPKMIEPSRPSD